MNFFRKIIGLTVAMLALLVLTAAVSPLSATVLPTQPRSVTAGTASGNVGAEVVVPISINDPTGVGGIAFTIGYNPALFQFIGLEQATSGWTVNDGSAFKVPDGQVQQDVTYYNPYRKTDPYSTATYTTTSNSTLFYQFNDVGAPTQPLGRVLVSGASAVPLTGTVLFNARFSIKTGSGAVNGTTYPIKLVQSIINNPAAGYTVDTFLPVLVGTGPADTTGNYTTLDFPIIPAQLVGGGITVTAPTYSIGGKVTYGSSTGAAAAGSTVILQKETATGYVYNAQTTVAATGLYAFTGKSAGNYKLLVNPIDTTYSDYASAQAIALSTVSITNADVVLQLKPQPERVSGTVTNYIAGLQAKVLDASNNVLGVYAIAANGTWTSDLLPPGTYTWSLVYGNMSVGSYADGTTQNFDTSQLKSIGGNIAGLAAGTNVAVTASSVTGKLMKTVKYTASGGASDVYTINNLVSANDYVVSVVAAGFPVTYYNNKTDVTQATKVDAGASPANIDFTFIPPEGHITGTITDTGSAVTGMTVYGFEVNTFGLVQTTVGTGGLYDLKVKPGTYEVFVIKGNGKIFYFYNVDGTPTQTESGATLRTVTTGDPVANTNINITEADKTLTGKVTFRTATGDPAANVLIAVSTATQRALGLTGQDGQYSITGLINGVTYTVEMKPLTGNYAVQSATIVAGTNTTKDFIIDTGAVLSGTVTDSISSAAVGGAMLFLKDQTTGALVGGRVYFSGTDGAYSIGDIASGSFTLEVTHPDYQSFTADIVIGDADKTQNVALQKGGYFKGTVVDGSNASAPLSGVTIIVTRSGATPVYTVTNSAGAYSVYGLDQTLTDYMIIAQKRGYERQVTIMKQPATTDTAGNTVNFTLSPPVTTYTISGTVQDSNSVAIADAIVVVASKSKNFVSTATTDSQGGYTVTGLLNASDYKIVVIPGGNLPTQSASFTVSGANVTQSFTIQLGGDIGGTVAGPSATAKVYVFLYKGTTYVGFTKTVSGSFLFKGLTAGNDYKILVVSSGFTSQWYSGQSSIDNATTISSGTTNVAVTLQ